MTAAVDFDRIPFLVIGEQPVSLGQTLGYLQLSGTLVPLIREMVNQHVLLQEIQSRSDLEVSLSDLEQTMIDFRLKQELTDADRFQQWLASQGLDHATWQNRVLFRLKVNRLMEKITESPLLPYFEQHRSTFDQVELACIITPDATIANQISQQVAAHTTLEQVLQAYAPADSQTQILRGLVRQGRLPQELRSAIATATPGEVIGPKQIEQRWCVFQVGQHVPATLDRELKRELQARLFQQWLAEKVLSLSVQLVNQSPLPSATQEPSMVA
ncbi:peptidyl-prolyl cis-trans isomerase [Pantanalinema rosaneae CENA516]|uniref:peptidylprolyl isomerase n=1 Tax=Pantanalinema rosaneae TaxID=1620701 RepID=UPI003D70211F